VIIDFVNRPKSLGQKRKKELQALEKRGCLILILTLVVKSTLGKDVLAVEKDDCGCKKKKTRRKEKETAALPL